MSAVCAVAQPVVAPRGASIRRRGARNAAVPASRTGPIARAAGNGEPLIKVCGVTTPEDARYAAEAGATFIGMILWPHSKRSISLEMGKQIADVCKEVGATPVGVFVDETSEEIVNAIETTGCTIAQLHGDKARAALETLPMSIPAIYAVSATPEAGGNQSRAVVRETRKRVRTYCPQLWDGDVFLA